MDEVKETSTTVKNEKQNILKAQDSNSKKRKNKEVAIFGNYKNYYGYRIEKSEEDPRIKVFRREWFEGKDCLDIGCNSGLITITIAKKFGCRSILGVDIDTDRIQEAYWNLRKTVRASTGKLPPNASTSKDVKGGKVVEHSVTELSSEEKGDNCDVSSPSTLLDRVSFQTQNFVHSQISKDKCYHTIICLSVTKWIHLNWGDEGLITLFSKIWRLLKPGGMFIVEPQPWSSYASNRSVSETAKSNYKTIEIFPESFQDILLDKIGFRLVENISCQLSGSKSGFQRPILAFWK